MAAAEAVTVEATAEEVPAATETEAAASRSRPVRNVPDRSKSD